MPCEHSHVINGQTNTITHLFLNTVRICRQWWLLHTKDTFKYRVTTPRRMTNITRTSPLNLTELRRTQRRLAALLQGHVCTNCGRHQRIPVGFCYICNHLDLSGRPELNPNKRLYGKGGLHVCNHIPSGPHPSFINEDSEADDDFDWNEINVSDTNGIFDTTIIRPSDDYDPREFKLPSVFGKDKQRQVKKSRKGRLLPVVSENTFVTTNKRDLQAEDVLGRQGDDPRLPPLSNLPTSLVGEEMGQIQERRKAQDPRRLHSERIDRRDRVLPDIMHRPESANTAHNFKENSDFLREKTDPPPLPIIVSIRKHDGEEIHTQTQQHGSSLTYDRKDVTSTDDVQRNGRKFHRKMRRKRSPTGSESPTFSGSISISRETTLSGTESPDLSFMSRLRSASWCECLDHTAGQSRCAECRKFGGHEKWCVSRNSVCPKCGKAYKRKYPHLERKSSFSSIPAESGIVINNAFENSTLSTTHDRKRCSPSKTTLSKHNTVGECLEEESAAADNRVHHNDGDRVASPQHWGSFGDSGFEDDKMSGQLNAPTGDSLGPKSKREKKHKVTYLHPVIDGNIHKRAYEMALADAALKRMFSKKKVPKVVSDSKGLYFSYFPLLKIRPGAGNVELDQSYLLGLRADTREGKRLKVKKGLKHILGDINMDDYYPGGKRNPKSDSQQSKKNKPA